jgi:thiamine biosynthesis protein ThiS
MKINVNGKARDCGRDNSLDDLLREMGAVPDRVAVVLNDDVVSPKRVPYVILKEGDRIEILTLAAGG